MTDEPKFELEDEPPATPRRRVPPPSGNGHSADAPDAPIVPPAREESEVDTRTVAERLGKAVPRIAGVRPPPPGWPLESLVYPFRRWELLAVAAGITWAFDLVGWWNLLVGWIWKVVLLVFLLRWQTHAIGTSAAGQDAPPSFDRAVDLDREDFRRIARFGLLAILLAAPGLLALLAGSVPLGWGLLASASAWLASAALGDALSDPALKRPAGVLEWMGRRPLALLVGSLGWWAFGLVEWLIARMQSVDLGPSAVVLLLSRAAATWTWLVSARALGVAGRTWVPWEERDRESGSEGDSSPPKSE